MLNLPKSIWCLIAITAFAAASSRQLRAQGACGGKPCPRIIVTTNRAPRATSSSTAGGTRRRERPPSNRPRSGATNNPGKPTAPAEVGPCDDAELVVVCHMPGCEITLDGQEKHVTDGLGGFTFQVPANTRYRIRVTKPGYEPYERSEQKLDCGDHREVSAQLVAKPVTLRLRTIPTECDIYLDRQKQPVGSDSGGRFSYTLSRPTLLIEAKKTGYLSATHTIVLAPEWANREVVLQLEPISARVKLSVNVDDAEVVIDSEPAKRNASERLLLKPGPHVLTIQALGYAPAKLDLTVAPDESVSREIQLARLPVAALVAQAEALLAKRAFDDVMKLSRYIFEADKENGAANSLEGYVHLARGDFGKAGDSFKRALVANVPIALRIRRHTGEKFELSKGHDLCEGQLIFRRSAVEFRSLRNPAEDFAVPYESVQVGAIQLKSSIAVYLGTKVTANAKRRDYNLYSYDRELSQSGKPYLEMIQRLLRPH